MKFRIVLKPRGKAASVPYVLPAKTPVWKADIAISDSFIEDAVIALIHRPNALLRIYTYGSGIVKVGDVAIKVEPFPATHVVRGNKYGVTLIRVKPFEVVFIEVSIVTS